MVRVAQIGYDMVAVSNTPTPEQIHSMLDRHATAAWPFAGSSLLRQHYHEVPMLPLPSLAWGVGHIELPFTKSGSIQILGFSLPLVTDSTFIASVTPALSLGGSLNVKVVEIAPSIGKAASQADALNILLIGARTFTVPLADNAANNSLKELLKTTEITQKRERVVITATLSPSLFSSPAQSDNTPSEAPAGSGAAR
jgi:hypothetical protein